MTRLPSNCVSYPHSPFTPFSILVFPSNASNFFLGTRKSRNTYIFLSEYFSDITEGLPIPSYINVNANINVNIIVNVYIK